MGSTLYRKYRSRSLDEVVGQEHVTTLLARALAAGSIAHAYLLTGPHGVGKTSVARILAHEINQLPYSDESAHLDIIEIDAASNNSVDDVRDLREKVHIAPTSAARKVYIIDEVHMLSKPAFNALLKTLEEPPAHVVFILATTDVDKLPATILSRVQRFNFGTIGQEAVTAHLRMIAEKEAIAIDDAALARIARHGRGSFRDSISLLDQLRHLSDGAAIAEADVERALGLTPEATIAQLIAAHRSGDLASLAQTITDLERSGASSKTITHQLVDQLRETLLEHPADVALIDRLLASGQSSYPFMKLLVALAPSAPQPSVAAAPAPTQPKKPVAPKPPKPEPKPEVKSQSAAPQPPLPPPSDFDWQAVLAAAKSDIALSSLLRNTGAELTGSTLKIFAGSNFTAKRLESSNQQAKLHALLHGLGYDALELAITPDKAPPSDSQAAAVAAIMGGGEEVEIDGE